MKTLFVSAFLSIYNAENAAALRGVSERMGSFIKLAKTGIPIRLFVCPVYESAVREAIVPYPNVQVHRVLNLSDTRTYSILEPYRDKLPSVRSAVKDTFEYITLMNAKMEFIQEVMDAYEYEQYAWIDFNIWYIIRNDLNPTYTLAMLANNTLVSDADIYMQGCWNWTKGMMIEHAWQRILWRFCGGFFIGRAAAMRKYCALMNEHLGPLIQEAGALTWEVNIWHLMESRELWTPIWFCADHNEDMIAVPGEYIQMPAKYNTVLNGRFPVGCLHGSAGTVNGVYELLPRMYGFWPSSIAFCRLRGGSGRIMNVRYVNYELTPQGAYIIHHPLGHLCTKNIACELDDTYAIQSIRVLADKPADITSLRGGIEGLEDIRLFEVNGDIRFIATQREFSQENVNRMMTGRYAFDQLVCNDVTILEPPKYTGCEKNWVPIVRKTEGGDDVQYIYGWGPLRVGSIQSETRTLEITSSVPSRLDGILGRMKGSSTFVDCSDGTLLGVIHYSEDGSPRRYFHCLIRLKADTLEPIALSHPFVFQKVGIEFCVGFDIEEGGERYRFWYSQHDKNPAWCSVPVGNFFIYTC